MSEQLTFSFKTEKKKAPEIFPEEKERYRELLRQKLPELKKTEGFPIGEDEDILALSDPPYYTACPNPFIDEFIRKWEWEKHLLHHQEGMTDTEGRNITEEIFDSKKCLKCIERDRNYHREPFTADVSEGKNHPIYNAHSYHTKVPHKAIMRYILHYTEPGDIVFDGFCGTGMTGVAAQLCGDRKAVEELGYVVKEDGTILAPFEGNGKSVMKSISKLGARKAVLNDLSPAATFIAYNYNTPVDVAEFEREAKRILAEVEKECGWMYETQHMIDGKVQKNLSGKPEIGRINYTVWSDVFVCPECASEIVFWDAAVDKDKGEVRDDFPCPGCGAALTKRQMDRALETKYDKAIKETVKQAKQVPVLINYTVGKKRYEKKPDDFDLALISKIEQMDIPYWVPTNRMPEGYNTEQPRRSHGASHVHHFYTKRNLWALGAFFSRCCKNHLTLYLNQFFVGSLRILGKWAKLNKERRRESSNLGWINAGVTGTMYISSAPAEQNVLFYLSKRLKKYLYIKFKEISVMIMTNPTAVINIPSHTIDYIFTDPPFGGNLMYSELNFIWEAWLKVFTNNKSEAIVNNVQKKGVPEYLRLMEDCFKEYHRVLKSGRCITVEFHNSSDAIWKAIQEAMLRSGLMISHVSILDKKQGSFKQVTTTRAPKQDLVISAYKPVDKDIKPDSLREISGEEVVWNFVAHHLRHLPVFVGEKGAGELVVERTPRFLFDRMVAYFVQRGYAVPMSSGEFQARILEKFPERDGMMFLPEQIPHYEKEKITLKVFMQLTFFVEDESSAIEWIRQSLKKKPQTYQDLVPDYMKELQHLDKFEKMPELLEILEQNFLQYTVAEFEKKAQVPRQIASYLRANYHNHRGLDDNDPEILKAAKGRWYVPDPNQSADLEKIRDKALLREFTAYIDHIKSSKKKLKQFRIEAIRCGFKDAWQKKVYKTIVEVGNHLPDQIVQEDQTLLMYFDNASIRVEE